MPVKSGRTLTDLPVRQTHYWPHGDGSPALEGPAMLLASYDDGPNVGFWDGLRPRRPEAWKQHRAVAEPEDPWVSADCEKHPNLEWCSYKAPRLMVEEVAPQLAVVRGLTYMPWVRNASFRDRGDAPFSGG